MRFARLPRGLSPSRYRRSRIIALVLTALLHTVPSVSGAARVQGCPGIPPLSGFGSWSFATPWPPQPGIENCVQNNSVSFLWTAPWNGLVAVKTCGGDASDTVLGVYSPCSSTFPAVACADDGCGGESHVFFAAQGGTEYRIDIGTFWQNDQVSAGLLTIEPYSPAGTRVCFGDGSGTACPCGNASPAGRGCRNSVDPAGAILVASGQARVGSDTLVLASTGLPDGTTLFFQGDQVVANGAGSLFGDGLRCVGGSVIRLDVVSISSNAARDPQTGGTPLSVRGGVIAGNVRHYQTWYRDAAAFCSSSTLNLTNGLSVTWMP